MDNRLRLFGKPVGALLLPVLYVILFAISASAQSTPATFVQGTPGPSTTSGTSSPAIAAPSSESFLYFERYPTEVRQWLQMSGTPPTAYYRDEFVGGYTFTSGANDGDTMTATLLNSSGTVIAVWGNDVFYSSYSYNGQTLSDCFVYPNEPPICGTNSIYFLWYYQSQCLDGDFSMQFYLNGAPIAGGPFPLTVLPQIEDSRVPNYSQAKAPDGTALSGSSQYAYDFECYITPPTNPETIDTCHSPLASDEAQFYIQNKGCFLTDVANVLTYHGDPTDPVSLNDALEALNTSTSTPPPPPGYSGHGVDPRGVLYYSKQQGNAVSEFDRTTSNLFENICAYGPQLMGVECHTNPNTKQITARHWVTVYGMTKDKSTWLIHDPGHSSATSGPGGGYGGTDETLAASLYGNTFCEARSFKGPQFTYTTEQGITIVFHSPVELLITDPQGRRLGSDPVTGATYNEIPTGYYDSAGLVDDVTGYPESNPNKTLFLWGIPDGQYTLTVTGTEANGSYSADITAYDANGTPSTTTMNDVAIGLDEVQTFTINYSSTPGSTIQLEGGFAGAGQNPSSVNLFLTYAAPTASRTTLPLGTASYTVVIDYSSAVIPSSFSAVLNGSTVTNLFHPIAGTSEAVTIPLVSGSNVLNVQIDGTLPNGHVATDKERLVFDVK